MDTGCPVQSPNDPNKYRVIKLDNGLRAMLICRDPNPVYKASDKIPPNSDAGDSSTEDVSDNDSVASDSDVYSETSQGKAAIGLCIHVGGFADPDDVPGLAHVTEHLVFLGNRKYPKESGMDDFLEHRGGSCNAFTEAEHTVFSLDVEESHLKGALSRFAQFFVSPIFKASAIARETKSIDNEFQLAIQDDDNRLEQLYGNIARKSHPMSKFLWGSADTLSIPPESLSKRLQEFHKKNYVAPRMTLVIQAGIDLNVLEKQVHSIFAVVPPSADPKPNLTNLNPPYEMTSFNKLYKIVPVEEVSQVLLSWCLPTEQPHYRAKPLVYLGWLLGHAGPGSIASYLHKRNWIIDLEAETPESETLNNTCCTFFQVSVTLSEDGFKHLGEVVTIVFEYLALLRSVGPSRRIFDEIKVIKQNGFLWDDQTQFDPLESVEALCQAMQHFPTTDFLTGGTLLHEFNDQVIRSYTEALRPDNVNIMMISKSYEQARSCNQECPWFRTKYGIEDIPSGWIERWTGQHWSDELKLPEPNIFIPTDFSLKEADVPDSEYPVVFETPFSTLWYRKDTTFKVPFAHIYIHLTSSCIKSAKNTCITELVVNLLEKRLLEDTHDAQQANLNHNISAKSSGIVVSFSGFNDKLELLVRIFFNQLVDLKFTQKEFDIAISDLKTTYDNYLLQAAHLSTELQMALLVHNHWTKMDRVAVLPSITVTDLETFISNFLATSTFRILVQGNYSAQDAKDLQQWMLKRMSVATRPPSATTATSSSSNESKFFVTELPCGSRIFRTINRNKNDDNCCLKNVYQFGRANLQQQLLMELFIKRLSNPLFDTLRTKLHLGYDVFCAAENLHGILGFFISVNGRSSKHSMRQLNNNVEKFLASQLETIDTWLDEEKFQKMVESMMMEKGQKDANLEEEADRNWIEITDGSSAFDRPQRQIQQLKDLKYGAVKDFFTKQLEVKGRRKISIQVIGSVNLSSASSVQTSRKRRGSHLGGSEKKRRRINSTKRAAATIRQNRNKDDIPQKGFDSKGNIYIRDISLFKGACQKHAASKIM